MDEGGSVGAAQADSAEVGGRRQSTAGPSVVPLGRWPYPVGAQVTFTVAMGEGGLIRGARAGEPWALRQVFAALGPRVTGYLRAQGVDDPDDLANEVFLRAFRGLARFEGDEERFRSWVFTIAHNVLIDERRRESRRPTVVLVDRFDALDRGAGDVEAEAVLRLDERALRDLLEGLTSDQRDSLLLRILGDLTAAQIGALTGKRPGTVKALQRRGLAALRQQWGERERPTAVRRDAC